MNFHVLLDCAVTVFVVAMAGRSLMRDEGWWAAGFIASGALNLYALVTR